MADLPAELGALHASFGRDESPRRRYMQAALLGVFASMFIAPAFGFPILASGPRYLTFLGTIIAVAVLLTALFAWLRPRRAARLHERGVVLVSGNAAGEAPFDAIQRAAYERNELRIETRDGPALSLRLGRAEAAAFLQALQKEL